MKEMRAARSSCPTPTTCICAPGTRWCGRLGGLHKFMNWDGPILTDSGGFQVFSLAGLRKIKEEGVTFASHIDGRRIFMGPEESMQIQSNLGSDIAMAFDECVENPATYEYAKASVERTLRWLERCKAEHDRLNALPDTVNPQSDALRHQSGRHLSRICASGTCRRSPSWTATATPSAAWRWGSPPRSCTTSSTRWSPICPKEKPRYLMGVGTPSNIIEGVARGVDFFDCVMPARNARHAKLFTWSGALNIRNEKYKLDERPIDPRLRLPGVPLPSPGPICATSLQRRRCWPCVWRCFTTSISTTNWPNVSARRWTRANSRHSGRSIPRNWPGGCEVSVNEAKRACQNLLFAL